MLVDYELPAIALDLAIRCASIPPDVKGALVLLVFLGVLLFFEHYAPCEKFSKKSRLSSYKNNLALFFFNTFLMSLLSVASLCLVAKHYTSGGLFSVISNTALKAVLSYLALDFVLYLWHRLCHTFDTLWLFHKVHHSEPSLNVTTAFRVHFIEVLLTNLIKTICIVVLGIEEMMVLTSEIITTLCIMFHHTNIAFKAEKWLGKLIVVPSMHRTHHSVNRYEHDSNYGAVLSIWDTLFATRLELERVTVGINDEMADDLFSLLSLGFKLKPMTAPSMIPPTALQHMIAEAAYYKAEKRGFSPGYDIQDWFDAQKEIVSAVYGAKSVKNMTVQFNQLIRQ